jgi:hypothetical protein
VQFVFVLLAALAAAQSPRDAGCPDWRGCRQLALDAADRGEYETFHDLAWRAVQLGPRNDPALMSLLARAQALSGRPHDALVMLARLADMGVALDVDTDEAFSRTRQLPGWSEVAARLDRVRHANVPDAPAAPNATRVPEAPRVPDVPNVPTVPDAAPVAATPALSAAAPAAAPAAVEAVRFSTTAFRLGGLAYDAVSGRFLFADRLAHKLFIVSERSNHATDFVRGESAGFRDIAGIEIDGKRGDLWVAGSSASEGTATLHKLQLVSGRVLRSFTTGPDLAAAAFVDLAVTSAGAVLALDSAGRQLLMLRPGATTLERVVRFETQEPTAVATGEDEAVAYVAHRDGVLRVDLRARTATRLTAPSAVSLDRFERIRRRDRSLIAVRVDEDGTRRLIRLDLNGGGRRVARATALAGADRITGPVFVTFVGDDLVYLADDAAGGEAASPVDASSPAEFVVYRLRLR